MKKGLAYRGCFVVLLFAGITGLSLAQQAEGPKVTAIEPKGGVTTPGAKVTVYGAGFSPDAEVYFGGLAVRETKFVSSSTLEVVTPYLRPGTHEVQLKSAGAAVRSEISFAVSPGPVDHEIDRAVAQADSGRVESAIAILKAIAESHSDYQVRALAHYQAAQVYFSKGDWWRWAGEASSVYDDSDKAGRAVQTFWRYRLALQLVDYLLPTGSTVEGDLKSADWTVSYDITENPKPRFYRGLFNARYGNLDKAKIDRDFILSHDPDNPSYRALAAYIAVLSGEKATFRPFSSETTTDARALALMGEAGYLSGDSAGAHGFWKQAAKIDPRGASLAFWAGKKHVALGQKQIAESLLTECIVMAPDSKDAEEAKELLAKIENAGIKASATRGEDAGPGGRRYGSVWRLSTLGGKSLTRTREADPPWRRQTAHWVWRPCGSRTCRPARCPRGGTSSWCTACRSR